MADDFQRMTRRDVLVTGGAAASALAAGGPFLAKAQEAVPTEVLREPVRRSITLTVNGQAHAIEADTRLTLLDAFREQLGLTGSKKGCDHGQCGACTILVDGRRIDSCLTLAVMHEGNEIVTIEGLAKGEDLHPMQAAFVEHDGFQCGYCTPGQICSAVGMLAELRAGWPSHASENVATAPALTDGEIRERMSGNICRCAAYPNIVAAIRHADGRQADGAT